MAYSMKSPWVYWYQGAGCNGCGAEAKVLLTAWPQFSRFGFRWTTEPAQADILLITGLVDRKSLNEVWDCWERMGQPKAAVAAGACAIFGGTLTKPLGEKSCLSEGPEMDFYVSGCAVAPGAILNGLRMAAEHLKERGSEK